MYHRPVTRRVRTIFSHFQHRLKSAGQKLKQKRAVKKLILNFSNFIKFHARNRARLARRLFYRYNYLEQVNPFWGKRWALQRGSRQTTISKMLTRTEWMYWCVRASIPITISSFFGTRAIALTSTEDKARAILLPAATNTKEWHLSLSCEQVTVLLDHTAPPVGEGAPPEPFKAVDAATARRKASTAGHQEKKWTVRLLSESHSSTYTSLKYRWVLCGRSIYHFRYLTWIFRTRLACFVLVTGGIVHIWIPKYFVFQTGQKLTKIFQIKNAKIFTR